jgi:hypothetical protein
MLATTFYLLDIGALFEADFARIFGLEIEECLAAGHLLHWR